MIYESIQKENGCQLIIKTNKLLGPIFPWLQEISLKYIADPKLSTQKA